MTGNVWEWTCDEPRPAGTAPRPCCNPSEARERIPRRVIKGGSHLCAPNYCLRYRPAARQFQASTRPHRISGSVASCGPREPADPSVRGRPRPRVGLSLAARLDRATVSGDRVRERRRRGRPDAQEAVGIAGRERVGSAPSDSRTVTAPRCGDVGPNTTLPSLSRQAKTKPPVAPAASTGSSSVVSHARPVTSAPSVRVGKSLSRSPSGVQTRTMGAAPPAATSATPSAGANATSTADKQLVLPPRNLPSGARPVVIAQRGPTLPVRGRRPDRGRHPDPRARGRRAPRHHQAPAHRLRRRDQPRLRRASDRAHELPQDAR
jgi:sulfatase-modifying factor enzyme 1